MDTIRPALRRRACWRGGDHSLFAAADSRLAECGEDPFFNSRAGGLAQNAVLFAVVVASGLVAARSVGMGAPYVAALLGGPAPARPLMAMVTVGATTGIATGLFMIGADFLLLPRLPALFDLALKSSLWENFSASFYGGINEELLTRLLGVSGLTSCPSCSVGGMDGYRSHGIGVRPRPRPSAGDQGSSGNDQ